MAQREDVAELLFAQGVMIVRALDDQDDLRGYLLKIHLMTEGLMEACMRIVFGEQHGNAILKSELNYQRKLIICTDLLLDDGRPLFTSDTVGSLRKLNTLRNELAHSLDAAITPEKAENLFVGGMKSGRDPGVVNGDAAIKLRSYSAAILEMLGKLPEA